MTVQRVEVKCAKCGEALLRTKASLEGRKHVFCDRECATAFMRSTFALPSHAIALLAWEAADPATRGRRPTHPKAFSKGRPIGRGSKHFEMRCRLTVMRKAKKAQEVAARAPEPVIAKAPVHFDEDVDPREDPRFPRRPKKVER